MRAIILHQPYATLVALGVKHWETRGAPPNGSMRPAGARGMPGLGIEPGERIAIAAGLRPPGDGMEVGEWQVESWRDAPHAPCLVQRGDTAGRGQVHDLPLGRVVCTAVVAEALPIVDVVIPPGLPPTLADAPVWNGRHRVFVGGGRSGMLMRTNLAGGPPADISDQLPYGDWQPGRWAWRLTNVEQVDGPVEVVRGNRQGVFDAAESW